MELFKTQPTTDATATADATDTDTDDTVSAASERKRKRSISSSSEDGSSESESDGPVARQAPVFQRYKELKSNNRETNVIQFDPTTASIVVGYRRGMLIVWDVDSGTRKCGFFAGDNVVLLQCRQGRAVVCALDKSPFCFDLTTHQRPSFVFLSASLPVVGLRVNTRFIVTCSKRQVEVWCAKDGARLHQIDLGSRVASMALHPDYEHVLALGLEHGVEVWSLAGDPRRLFTTLQQEGAVADSGADLLPADEDPEATLYAPKRFLVGIVSDGSAIVASRISPIPAENSMSILHFDAPASFSD